MPLQRLGSAGAFIAEFANPSRRGRSEEGGTTTMRECGTEALSKFSSAAVSNPMLLLTIEAQVIGAVGFEAKVSLSA
jgi:hypothetical protein